MFTVYILFSPDCNRFYVGQCQDVEARLLRHNNKMVPSTRAFAPWNLIYTEKYPTRALAMQREIFIKKQKSSIYIQKLTGNKPISNNSIKILFAVIIMETRHILI